MKKILISFLATCFLFLSSSVSAEVLQDNRSDYREIPAYYKSVQFIVEQTASDQQVIYFKQNLGFSDEPSGFVLPFKGEDASVEMISKGDPGNDLLDEYALSSIYAQKYAKFKNVPTIYSKKNKEDLYAVLKKENIDLNVNLTNQIDNWFNDDLKVLLLIVNPVEEARSTWTRPIKINLKSADVNIPLGWLRTDIGSLTTSKGKVIYAEDFESSNGGWQDEYMGSQANSLITRDNSEYYEGEYSLKAANKPGSINALTTLTIGNLVPGERYTFSAYVKNTTGTQGYATLRVMGDGLVALSSTFPLYEPKDRAWQRMSMTFQARTAYHYFTLMGSQDRSEYINWDNVQLEKGENASAFNKDAVGTKNEKKPLSELDTSMIDFDVLVLGQSPYKNGNPLVRSKTYALDNHKLPSSFEKANIKYITQIRGTINPNDFNQFFQAEITNTKSVEIDSLTLRKAPFIETKKDIKIGNFPVGVLVFIALVLILKYYLTVSLKLTHNHKTSVLSNTIYILAWFIQFLTALILSPRLFSIVVDPPSVAYFVQEDIFMRTLFFMSSLVYIVSMWFVFRTEIKTLRKMVEVQLGIIIIALMIVIPLFISNIMNGGTYKFVQAPNLFFLSLEIIILGLAYLKMKKHEYQETPQT